MARAFGVCKQYAPNKPGFINGIGPKRLIVSIKQSNLNQSFGAQIFFPKSGNPGIQ